MNHPRIALGLAAWFLGMLIPVAHHALLHLGSSLGNHPTSNVVLRSQSLWKHLPVVDWIYLAAMAVVGAILLMTGMKGER